MRPLISMALVGLSLPLAAFAAKPQDVHIQWTCPAGSYPDTSMDRPNCKAKVETPAAQQLRVKEVAPVAAAPGAAVEQPAPPSQAELVTSAKLIPFDISSDRLDDASKATLDDIARSVHDDPSIAAVRIVGHADVTGTEQGNDQLSSARADNVRQYLEQQGVPAEKIATLARGANAPKATNETEAGRVLNRSAVVITLK